LTTSNSPTCADGEQPRFIRAFYDCARTRQSVAIVSPDEENAERRPESLPGTGGISPEENAGRQCSLQLRCFNRNRMARQIRGLSCDEKAKWIHEFKSKAPNIPVFRVAHISENRSKSARVRAICDDPRTRRALSLLRFAQIGQFLSGRDLPRSTDHRRRFAWDSACEATGHRAWRIFRW
jgi:hypothetical protein